MSKMSTWGRIRNSSGVFGYFATGLQPYDKSHNPIPCPECCHEYHRILNELIELKNSKDLIDSFRSSELEDRLHEIIKEDPDAISWRFFQMPKPGSDAEVDLHKLLNSAFFLKDDILKIGVMESLLNVGPVSHDRKRIREDDLQSLFMKNRKAIQKSEIFSGDNSSICHKQVVIKPKRDLAFEKVVWDKKIQPIINRCYHDVFLFDPFPEVEELSNEAIQRVHNMVVSFFSRSVNFPTQFSQIDPTLKDGRAPKEFMKAFDDLVLKKMRAGLNVLIKNEDGQRIDNKDTLFEFIQDLYDTATLPSFLTYLGLECGVENHQFNETHLKKNQKDKLECQKIAREIWEEHPTLMIKYMKRLQSIKEITHNYKEKTSHTWLSEIAPKKARRKGKRSNSEIKKQHEICKKLNIPIQK